MTTDTGERGWLSRALGPPRSIAHRLPGDAGVLPVEGRLAPFDGASGWLNSAPLTPAGLRGRVVLVDFWTYTCVNWLRTLPYVREWAARYAEDGLVVVGVHTPEFGFEHDQANVARQAGTFGVTYPVALDNGYRVWSVFANHFWPAVYLADSEGRIRYHHFGEGEYAMTEMAIQQLLMESGTVVAPDLVAVRPTGLEVAADWQTLRSPETYLGSSQTIGFASPQRLIDDDVRDYAEPGTLPLNPGAPIGSWSIPPPAAALAERDGRLAYRFHARDVNLVMGPVRAGTAIRFRVSIDGEPAIGDHGTDVGPDATGVVTEQRTYQLIRQAHEVVERTFEIEF